MATNGLLLFCLIFVSTSRSFAENTYAKYDIVGVSASHWDIVNFSEHRVKRDANSTEDISSLKDDVDTGNTTSGSSQVTNTTKGDKTTSKPEPAVTNENPGLINTTPPKSANTIDLDIGSQDNPFKDSDIHHDFHKYYRSEYKYFKNGLNGQWIELEKAVQHNTLSDGHRVAAVIPLKFNFSFYGHELTKVTVATGGFIYMSPFLHQWLTATQYIAPLMANFDPSISNSSAIYYQSENDRIIIEWKNLYLQDQQTNGGYHFQATLFANSTIKFAYKNIPQPVVKISSNKHPVKVGLSDAYYNDTMVPKYDVKRRTIFEYHKVALNQTKILSNTIVFITPEPTCNTLRTCDACSRHQGVNFECKWCNKIGRCSDGMDWYRQHWDKQGCKENHTVNSSSCSSLPKPTLPNLDPHDTSMYNGRRCRGNDCNDNKTSPTTIIVVFVIIFVVILVSALGTWVYYAYTHPTSKSGMWLMEHRPSQLGAKIKFWKSSSASGAKYQTETEA